MKQSPTEMPQTERRLPQAFGREIAEGLPVSAQTLKIVAERGMTGKVADAGIVESEIATGHDLLQQETAPTLVGRHYQMGLIEKKQLLHHVHHGASDDRQSATLQHLQGLGALSVGLVLVQHVVVIDQLPQADAALDDVTKDMDQLVDTVEGHRRHTDLAVRQGDGVGKLHGYLRVKIGLQSTVVKRMVHERGPIVDLNFRVLEHAVVYMMIDCLACRSRLLTDVGQNSGYVGLPLPRDPKVDVAGGAHGRVRIEQGIALPFQQATAEAIGSQLADNLDNTPTDVFIGLTYHLSGSKPRHQHLLVLRTLLLGHPLNTGKQHTDQRLPVGHIKQNVPVACLKRKVDPVCDAERKAKDFEELFAFQGDNTVWRVFYLGPDYWRLGPRLIFPQAETVEVIDQHHLFAAEGLNLKDFL